MRFPSPRLNKSQRAIRKKVIRNHNDSEDLEKKYFRAVSYNVDLSKWALFQIVVIHPTWWFVMKVENPSIRCVIMLILPHIFDKRSSADRATVPSYRFDLAPDRRDSLVGVGGPCSSNHESGTPTWRCGRHRRCSRSTLRCHGCLRRFHSFQWTPLGGDVQNKRTSKKGLTLHNDVQNKRSSRY